MKSWRDRMDTPVKVASLDARFRPQVEAFLDALQAAGILVAVGDARRDLAREWVLWTQGRICPPDADPANARAYRISDARQIVTHVRPGSGKGPHPYGLAADIYPLNEAHQLMDSAKDPNWSATITRMWQLAESLGIDALGHRTDAPGDEFWSGDPAHFQALSWRTMTGGGVTDSSTRREV